MEFLSCVDVGTRACRGAVGRFAVLALLFTSCLFCVRIAAAANTPPAAKGDSSAWVATWGSAMEASNRGAPDFSGQTLRQVVHTSVGGEQTRIWFSNRFGTEPLHIGAAHVALSAQHSGVQPGSDRALTFHHRPSVTIPPGATIVSDAVALHVPAFADLAVSTYFPDMTLASTEHSLALQTAYSITGNVVDAPQLAATSATHNAWYFLSGVDVYAPGKSAVVAFGDSITDGWRSTAQKNRRWPDVLATRLGVSPSTSHAGVLGVVNMGIGGNRVLLDGYGPNALSRFNRDVLARGDARYLIVLESINDIGRYADDHQPYGDLLQRLEWAFSQMAVQAHQHKMKIFAATVTPYGGCSYFSPAGEQVREQLNQWIRTTHAFDGVVDFAKATRDPQHPQQFLPQYDSGDHLHPNDAGYKAMADAIDLGLFLKRPGPKAQK
ncbi:MAG: SGNH/GDSL hydrolase family protein [Acidobacteriaceae bacterium]